MTASTVITPRQRKQTSTSADATATKGAHKGVDRPTSALTLAQIRAAIPADCFNKSPVRSLGYMARDLGLFLGMSAGMTMAMRSPQWHTASPAVTGATLALYWLANGFIMWCMFVVGHDCGHGSFSNSALLNAVCGHVCHAPLMVPFYAWADSHRRHHQYHNHYSKDYSFPWFTVDDLKVAHRQISHKIRVTFPFTGFFMYLAGLPDGGHWLPFGGRLWEQASVRRHVRGVISAVCVLAAAWVVLTVAQWDLWVAFKLYGGCWLFFSFWLVTVTYLQHHDEETIVYDEHWTFLRGAFQTIDREYGMGIDSMHHHITDCHLVHHLFYTRIPHYNLPRATAALRDFLRSKGLLKLHRRVRQHDFVWEVFRALYTVSFLAKKPTEQQLQHCKSIMPSKLQARD